MTFTSSHLASTPTGPVPERPIPPHPRPAEQPSGRRPPRPARWLASWWPGGRLQAWTPTAGDVGDHKPGDDLRIEHPWDRIVPQGLRDPLRLSNGGMVPRNAWRRCARGRRRHPPPGRSCVGCTRWLSTHPRDCRWGWVKGGHFPSTTHSLQSTRRGPLRCRSTGNHGGRGWPPSGHTGGRSPRRSRAWR